MTSSLTLSFVISEWETYAKNKYSPRTFKVYRRRLKELLIYFGNIPLKELTKQKIAEYIGNIQSPSVRSQVIASYSSLEKFLRDFYDIVIPSVPDFVKVKGKKPLPKPLNKNIVSRMLLIAEQKAKEGYPWKLASIILMAFAGLRASEVLSVKPENFFEDNNGNKFISVKGKGDKERIIPLPENKYTKWLWENKERVFPIEVGYQVLYETIKKTGKQAGDDKATPHRLRHFFGTYLSSKGIPIQVIQELMGHSNPKTTMNYVKVSDREKINAIKSVFED
jgi:integrase/recombinase XerD